MPGQAKIDLNHHGPPQQTAKLQAGNGHRRYQGISQGVLEDHPAFRETDGTGRIDILLAHLIQHGGTGQARGDRRQAHPERRGREQEMLRLSHRSSNGTDILRRRQPAQVEGEEQHTQNGKPEVGNRDPGHRRGGGRIIHHGAVLEAAIVPRGMAMSSEMITATHRQVDGGGNALEELPP